MVDAQKTPPKEASVVIIGGGVSGCSVAYHLAKLGWKDVVLLERKQLTSGTTWHAAGLIGQLRASHNLTRLAKYSSELYKDLEAETGIATGFRQCGSMTIALSEHRKQEILRQASLASAFDVEVEIIDPREVTRLYPHLSQKDMTAAAFIPKDGQGDPANIAQALAKGARMNGAKIYEMTKIEDIVIETPSSSLKHGQASGKKRVKAVKWRNENGDEGVIKTDKIVNAAGMWAADLGAKSGVTIPLHACEHFYIVTEAIKDLGQLPVLRVPDECSYYKEDAGKMLVGAFEPVAKPWGMDGISEDFCFDQLPEDIDHFGPILDQAIERMPMLAEAGIHTFFNGPESFTPDDLFYLGEAPFIEGYFVAAGYNSIGIASSGGAGKALAEWMDGGAPPFDLWDVDIRRAQPFQRNRLYLHDRVRETLGLLYADHFPYRQMESSRGVRRSPIHHLLKEQGAVFGAVAGYERANWFANSGQEAKYHYDWAGQNWFENHRNEHMAVREGISLFDMSSFGKIMVAGPDAVKFLNRLCANQIDVAVNKIVYTQMLNKRGGIESDLTVTRLGVDEFLLVVPVASLIRDLDWLSRHKQDDEMVIIKDISAGESVILLMGPKVRDLLSDLSKDDFSNAAQPFGRAREVELAMGLARAHRVSYVGELGYEFYIASDQTAHITEAILEAGKAHNLKLCGLHALDSCRIEKAFRHFGHDITDEDHLLEAGLGFAAKMDKGDFIGRDALIQKKEQGLSKAMMQFQLDDSSQFLFHHEPIWMNGKPVSFTTSANYGHYLGSAIAMGYIPLNDGMTIKELESQSFEIEIARQRHTAKASLKPLYDPTSAKVKG